MTNAHATMKLLTMRTIKVEKNIILYTNNLICVYTIVRVVKIFPPLYRAISLVSHTAYS